MNKRHVLAIGIIFLFSIPLILPLLQPGFFLSDDGEWMVIRFSAFYQSLRDGQFPVRFLMRLNHGYGYPVSNFLYPGFMYLGIPIHVIGFGFVDTIKIILGASMVGSSLFCYLWLSRIFNKWPSLVGGLIYLYAPYHVYDLYKRGSVGEVLSLAVLPFILWNVERKSFFWTTAAIAFLAVSHNTLAILFVGVVFLYMIFNVLTSKTRKNLLLRYILILLLSFGMSSFFWIPAFYDLQYTRFSQIQVSQWGEYFVDHTLIGISTFAVLIAAFILLVTKKILLSKHRLAMIFFAVAIVSIFLSISPSGFVWRTLPVSFIQFPFRFLSLTIISISFLAAFALSLLSRNKAIVMGCIFLLLTGLSSKPYIPPVEFFDKGEGFYSTNQDTTTVKNEYMPRWIKGVFNAQPEKKVEIETGNIRNVQFNTHKISFDYRLTQRELSLLKINTVYFPGWKVEIDGVEKPDALYPGRSGLIEIPIKSTGDAVRRVDVYFTETTERLLSDTLSMVCFILLIVLSIHRRFNILQ